MVERGALVTQLTEAPPKLDMLGKLDPAAQTFLKEQDRIRIWTSAFPDGTLLVEDGILSSFNGRETRWMAHCP